MEKLLLPLFPGLLASGEIVHHNIRFFSCTLCVCYGCVLNPISLFHAHYRNWALLEVSVYWSVCFHFICLSILWLLCNPTWYVTLFVLVSVCSKSLKFFGGVWGKGVGRGLALLHKLNLLNYGPILLQGIAELFAG